jgi:pimeloyl-ACP methyl ester carboxylesterase
MFWVHDAYVLAEHGYGVLLFDFRGHGASERAQVTLGDHERCDLRSALDFVDAQPGVDRIGAIGFSMGAATLTHVAAEDERLEAVILEASYPDLYSALMNRSRLFGPISQWPTLWMFHDVDLDAVRPVDDICRISPRPVLLIYGDQDHVLPPGSAQTMFEAACDPVELWIIHGAHHGDYFGFAPKSYLDRVVSFFDTNLR